MAHSGRWKIAFLCAAVAVSSAAACGNGDQGHAGAAGAAAQAASAGEGGENGADLTTLSDAQILLALETLNAGEVSEAQAALPHLTNPDVIAFAKRVVTDHTNAEKMVETTANELKLTPAPSAVERTLKDESQGHVAHFEMAGDSLDSDYMGEELTGHAQALEILTALEQAADADALRNLIASLKATMQSHYDAAKQIQTSP